MIVLAHSFLLTNFAALPQQSPSRALLLRLDACLSAYLEIDKTLARVTPFQAVDYDELSRRLLQVLRDMHDVREGFVRIVPPLDSSLYAFASDLLAAMEKLHTVIDALAGKANGRSGYGWFALRRDTKEYRTLVAKYAAAGERVNALVAMLMEDNDPDPIDVPEIARMIRTVAFHESRELAVLWGRTHEDLGASDLMTHYAYFLYVVVDLMGRAALSDLARVPVMTALRRELRALLAGSSAAAVPKERFDAIFDDDGAYTRCKTVIGEDSVLVEASEYFALRFVSNEPLERREALADETAKTLTLAVVSLLATEAFQAFLARRQE